MEGRPAKTDAFGWLWFTMSHLSRFNEVGPQVIGDSLRNYNEGEGTVKTKRSSKKF